MPAGTITVTNGSATVTGSGTSFKTELKAGDFIGVIAGGTPYTLIVASIASDTQLTIGAAYSGPNASGLAWNAVPASLLYAITQQVMNDMGTALRGMNSQLVNWQKIYSDAASVTVDRPDRSTFTGPGWGYMATQFTNKMDKSQNLNDVTDKATARANLGVAYGTAAGTVAQGNDSRITGALQKSGGNMTGPLNSDTTGTSLVATANGRFAAGNNQGNSLGAAYLNSTQYMTLDVWGTPSNIMTRIVTYNTNYHVFGFYDNGNGTCDGSWVGASDERHKDDIEIVRNPLKEVLSWRGCTYNKKDIGPSVGLIAQDVEKSCPAAVTNIGQRKFSDGTVIDDFKALDTAGVAAAYHTEAIKALFNLIELAIADPDAALKSIDSIKDALASGSTT